MSESQTIEITKLLQAWNAGDQQALEQLVPLVEKELRKIAKAYLRREYNGRPLQTTELIDGVFLRLIKGKPVEWQSRTDFFAISAEIMRRILVDEARKRNRAVPQITLAEMPDVGAPQRPDVIALDEALKDLARLDPLKSRIVEMRFFGGLTMEEIAEVLKLSLKKVKTEWSNAKRWLYRELSRESKESGQ